MSQHSNIATGSDAPTSDEERPEPINFTLIVVSPSVGVTCPLTFPHLPAATTVKELKAKIRDTLPSKPADESQRLIHRGRMLARDLETMLDIFGRETLVNPESQTLHLVLRPTGADPPSAHPTTPLVVPQRVTTPLAIPLQARPQSTPTNPSHGMPAQLPLPGFQQVAQHQILHQADHLQNMMAQRLQHLQQETVRLQQDMLNIEQRSRALAAGNPALFPQQPAVGQVPFVPGLQNSFQLAQGGFRTTQPMPASVQNLINQQQRERAAEGRQGAQDSGTTHHGAGTPTSGRASPILHRPDHTTTHTREGVGPNGERWQITVNETTTTFPIAQPPHHPSHHGSSNPVLDNLQAILRNADRTLPTQNLEQNLQQQAHHLNTANRVASNPPPTTTNVGQAPSEPSVGATTPATTTSSPSSSVLLNPISSAQYSLSNPTTQANPTSNVSGSIDPVVYLLSSPQGPRALLLNNSDTFYTPRQVLRRRRHDSPAPVAVPQLDDNGIPARFRGFPEFRNRNPDRRRARQDRNGQVQGQNRVEPLDPHANVNPGAGALAAQIGPMIWLIIRLAGFVWFFTAGNNSWTRFFMVTALAIGVFIVNTGIFNGIAERLWGPIRRHVEALIPLAGPEAALIPAANAVIPQQPEAAAAAAATAAPQGNEQGPRRRRGELDPAEVAARLMEQHRQANANWLMTQIRRAEHAALLFLASLVPGVGERHIAAREAEAAAAEAERQRRIEEAAAAEDAENANAEQAAENGGNQDNQDRAAQNTESESPPAQPLIEV